MGAWIVHFSTIENGKPYGISDNWGCAANPKGYQDLVVRTYLDTDPVHGGYGIDLEFKEIYSANAASLERRVKAIRALERKLDKLAEQFGSPKGWAEYLSRVYVAAGCSGAFFRKVDVRRDRVDGAVRLYLLPWPVATFRHADYRLYTTMPLPLDLFHRTAVYVTRSYGGVGGQEP